MQIQRFGQLNQIHQRLGSIQTVGVGLLLALPLSVTMAMAAIAQVNPNPSIFNEPPYNRSQRTAPPTSTPPLPEQLNPPSAQITPVNGIVAIKLVNRTNTAISYQVIGDTQQRSLAAQSEMTLQDLPTPVNMTFYRPDRGFLIVNTKAATQAGLLEVTFDPTADIGRDNTALTVDRAGAVFLN